MSKRQERRARRIAGVKDKAAKEAADYAASPVLCIDCSYGSARPYYHARPECAGACYPKEILVTE